MELVDDLVDTTTPFTTPLGGDNKHLREMRNVFDVLPEYFRELGRHKGRIERRHTWTRKHVFAINGNSKM